ncbi:hypothetical protein N658DRAFT_314356 [Parathielavia hyrcaniae]|uniref:Uncharacterized protein n=1 Tax=Parathielavia hyrcaniae TaxID=113614 RepID=A0AAN6PSD2_9PEZI|nr:hypothetical protein N658DRAFT_314356 [Parathielavia hyrcaniae]
MPGSRGFAPVPVKDADRLSPARRDHVQVPWFQCITHECRYHFQTKFDFDHWPVRRMDRQGRPMAIPWTFDQGQGHIVDLWHIAKVEPGKVCAWPLRAWPVACQVHDRWEMCRDATCVRHMKDKIANFHERQARQMDAPRPRIRKRRASDSQWSWRADDGSGSTKRWTLVVQSRRGTPLQHPGRSWETAPGPSGGPSTPKPGRKATSRAVQE